MLRNQKNNFQIKLKNSCADFSNWFTLQPCTGNDASSNETGSPKSCGAGGWSQEGRKRNAGMTARQGVEQSKPERQSLRALGLFKGGYMAKISLNVMTAETVRELLMYEPETGNFTWRVRPANNMRAGDSAGCLSKRDGYRLATQAENKQNTSLRRDSTSGHKGVSWHKRDKKWVAEIKLHGKKHYLGYFNNINDAIAARKSEESRLHPFAAA